MNPAMVRALGYLLGEVIAAGADINDIVQAADDTGKVDEQTWDRIRDEASAAAEKWRAARR